MDMYSKAGDRPYITGHSTQNRGGVKGRPAVLRTPVGSSTVVDVGIAQALGEGPVRGGAHPSV